MENPHRSGKIEWKAPVCKLGSLLLSRGVAGESVGTPGSAQWDRQDDAGAGYYFMPDVDLVAFTGCLADPDLVPSAEP